MVAAKEVQVQELVPLDPPVMTESPATEATLHTPHPVACLPAEQVAVQVVTPAPHELVICSYPLRTFPATTTLPADTTDPSFLIPKYSTLLCCKVIQSIVLVPVLFTLRFTLKNAAPGAVDIASE